MPNSYRREGIFHLHLTAIKDSYILTWSHNFNARFANESSYRKTPKYWDMQKNCCNYPKIQSGSTIMIE